MSVPGLATALKNAGVHVAVLDFDLCLMAMYEVAYELAGLADYLVFFRRNGTRGWKSV